MFYKIQYWFNAVVGSLFVPSRHYSLNNNNKKIQPQNKTLTLSNQKSVYIYIYIFVCVCMYMQYWPVCSIIHCGFTLPVQVKCELRQIILRNLQNTSLKSLQFIATLLVVWDLLVNIENLIEEVTYICQNYASLDTYHQMICSFLMVWGSYSSWLWLICCESFEIQFASFSSVRQ